MANIYFTDENNKLIEVNPKDTFHLNEDGSLKEGWIPINSVSYNKTEQKFNKMVETMERKYYTPTLEEFTVGFEYECLSGFMDGTVKTNDDFNNATWTTRKATIGELVYIERALTGKNAQNGLCGIRVPYLSKEDIEECGWKYSKVDAGTTLHFFNFKASDMTYCMDFDPDFRGKIWLRIYDIAGDFEEMNFFSGTIKNKSQLKQLMNWLNIKK